MRICRIVNILPNELTPGEGLVPYFLAKHIPEPTLYITRQHDGRRYFPLPDHVKVAPVIRESTTPPKLREAVFGGKRRGAIIGNALQALLAGRMLYGESRSFYLAMREIARFRPDIIICGSFKRLAYGVAAKRLFGCKLILSLHNTTETAALKNLGLLRRFIKSVDKVVVVSAEIARQLKGYVPEELIHISSTGVDLSEFVNRDEPRLNQLVAIGSFKWKKGYPILLEAVAEVFRQYSDYLLLIVGDGEERPLIEREIERLGLEGRVALIGILQRAEVVNVLNQSKIFVMASLHEGLPKVLLEAIACGTPAVVTDACNAEGIIEETGLSVPAGDAKALAVAIIRMIEERGLWEGCSANGPRVAARYGWKAVVEKDYAVYRELVARKDGRKEGAK